MGQPILSMDLKDIKAILDLMKKNSVSEFEMEKGDFKVRLKRDGVAHSREDHHEPVMGYRPPASPPQYAPLPVLQAIESRPAPARGAAIKSPMIGTFYRRPSPDVPMYVEVGAQVDPDTVVCIIEAMKVMNEIKAETRGIITEILVSDAKPVEYGQPLFRIQPN